MDSIPQSSGIYQILCVPTGKSYIGSAVSLHKRWLHHRRQLEISRHHNRFLQNAWNKHGADAFVFNILEYVADKSDLLAREQWWLDTLEPYREDVGYNLSPTSSSCLGVKNTPEARARKSAAKTGWNPSRETRKRMSESAKTKVFTPEHRANIGKAIKGRVVSDETREKRRVSQKRVYASLSPEARSAFHDAAKGRIVSDETRARMGASKTGRTLTIEHRTNIGKAVKGRVVSDETKARMSASGSASWTPERRAANSQRSREMWARRKTAKVPQQLSLDLDDD